MSWAGASTRGAPAGGQDMGVGSGVHALENQVSIEDGLA